MQLCQYGLEIKRGVFQPTLSLPHRYYSYTVEKEHADGCNCNEKPRLLLRRQRLGNGVNGSDSDGLHLAPLPDVVDGVERDVEHTRK